MNYEKHEIAGVIEHQTIEDLPSNGRDYIQLATLQPGVQISTGTIGQFNALFYVSVLGSGFRTAVTVDGGNVSDNIDVAGGGQSMNFTQEVVQEFQLSELNIDLSSPIQTGGSINVVTRSGSNDWHGSAYFFYRDHNMAAYPNLDRVGPESPFFIRRNPGASLGGPIIKDKLFFFFNYEFLNQVQAQSITTTDPAFALIQGTYASPYEAKKITARFDYHMNSKNNLFVRYSHDGNAGFGPALTFGDPSNWPHNVNWADQSILGWTTIFTPTLINDLRFQYNYWNNHIFPAVSRRTAPALRCRYLPNVVFFVPGSASSGRRSFQFEFSPGNYNTRSNLELVDSLAWHSATTVLRVRRRSDPLIGGLGVLYRPCRWRCFPDLGKLDTAAIAGWFGLVPLYLPRGPLPLTIGSRPSRIDVFASIFSGVGVGRVPCLRLTTTARTRDRPIRA